MTRWLIGAIACGAFACSSHVPETHGCNATLVAGSWECAVPGWPDRDYTIIVPSSYEPTTPIAVVVNFHGGGGSRRSASTETCPDGDGTHPACFHNELAEREGFAVVYPDGVPGTGLTRNLRSWNAGGGADGWRATGVGAVEADSDDTQYTHDLLDEIAERLEIDPARVYAMGLSNGGAMSHRLACTSDRFAAVAPIGGAMQWTTTHDCEPLVSVPMLYTHSLMDPCWVYDGGVSACPIGQPELKHVSAARTLEEWATHKGCTGTPVEAELPDTDENGSTTAELTFQGCSSPLIHRKPAAAGHTWPNGHQYLRERTVGAVDRDWGNEDLWAFFRQHSLEP